MAEIHPNDIGLATYEDVGDVAKLRTVAGTVVDAINEIRENSGGAELNFEQLYVEGEDNIIIGKNNIVYGNGNMIIGSNNLVIGNNINLISNGCSQHKSMNDISFNSIDETDMKLYYYTQNSSAFSFSAGDKIAVRITVTWTDDDWSSYFNDVSDYQVVEIIEHDAVNMCITVKGLEIESEPPDNVHTSMDYMYISNAVVLSQLYALEVPRENLNFGASSTGEKSFSVNNGYAKGDYSYAANYATAEGVYSTAVGLGQADKYAAFAANEGKSYGEYGVALNAGYNYAHYSIATGYQTKCYGRILKVTGLDVANKKITLASGQNTKRLTNLKFTLRCYISSNSSDILWRRGVISSVSGDVITYTDDNFYGGTHSSFTETLFPDSYIFIEGDYNDISRANVVGGSYSICGMNNTCADGFHILAAADGAVVFGKYGNLSDAYSLALANGTSLHEPGFAFKVLNDGSVHADGEYTTPCADYAEFFEWEDGNPDNEDRTGYFVKLKGDKITKCDEFDTPLGIVSATPAIVGDSGEMRWKDKFVTDDFGRIQYHDVVIPEEKDEEGNIVIEEHIETQPVINPGWNADEEYIPRSKRKEWSPVGVLGKLIVYDDGTLNSGDICRSGKNGIAVKSIKNGYTVLKRISDDKVMIWFYPTGHEKG